MHRGTVADLEGGARTRSSAGVAGVLAAGVFRAGVLPDIFVVFFQFLRLWSKLFKNKRRW